jgi:flagellar biosynthesis chaperone FliJ
MHIVNNLNIVTEQARSRQKRGWLGEILTAVFGVNDEVYRSIDELGDAQDELREKATHQSNLLISTVQEVNANTNKQIKELSDKVNQGINQINNMQAWHSIMDRQKVNYHMIAVSHESENAMREIAKKYDVILNAMINRGSLFDFITFYELRETLCRVTSKLPKEIEVEHEPKEELEITANNEQLTIHAFLSLREKSRYKLLAATAIPRTLNEHTLAATDTATKMIAIDFNGGKYFKTSVNKVEKCRKKPANLHSCITTSVHDLEKEESCLLSQILNRKNFWQCHITQYHIEEPLWVQLVMDNTRQHYIT